MHINATCLPKGARLETEVAIVGAGPAGITLALELADAGHRVLLIESGGNTYSRFAQGLGETTGEDSAHVPMSLATRRQIGGTSNLWAGRCVPFDRVDFEPRPLIGDSRWPVSYSDLESYFPRACKLCMCGEPTFDADEIPGLATSSLIPGWPEGDVRSTTLERWSTPTNFGRAYRDRLKSSQLVTLVTGLTCTEIVCAFDGASVEHLLTRTVADNRVPVRARRYVLACGGIETTRLLFASNAHHRNGIGNHSGHLGHWYMAHVGASVARVRFNAPARQTIYGFERDREGIYVRRRFTFAREYLLEHDLPNAAMWLENPEISDALHGDDVLSFIYLMLASPLGHHLIAEGTRQRKLETDKPVSVRQHIRNVSRNMPRTARFALTLAYERFLRRGPKVPGVFVPNASNEYRLFYHGEHLPHYDSRVAPSSTHDALGMPRMRTMLRFQDADIGSAIEAHEHFGDYLRRHRLGTLEFLYDDPAEGFRAHLLDGYHQAGTTRMSTRRADGVLDPQLAVHGFDDLFVASSSAFVTSGQANSTFMIVVFALRLADHLHRSLRETISTRSTRATHANAPAADMAPSSAAA